MRAGQLGVQDEAEAWIVLALLVSNLDVPVSTDNTTTAAAMAVGHFVLLEKSKVPHSARKMK